MLNEKFKKLILCGRVNRFHTADLIVKQNNSEHSFNCALMAYSLANHLVIYHNKFVDARACAMYMLTHDLGEFASGDIPGHIKHLYPEASVIEQKYIDDEFPELTELAYLNDQEKDLCHFVDKYESLFTVYKEVNRGNTDLQDMFVRIRATCYNLAHQFHEKYDVDLLVHEVKDFPH